MRGTQFAELSAFVAVAEEASFTKAAKRLGLSTATLSQTVRSLEERLGVRLLNRTTRSVALTEAGERMLRQLRPLLAEFEVHGSVVVNEPDFLIRAALEGIGVIYLMEEYVAPMIADGRLISLFDDSVLPRMPGFCMFYRSRRQNPAALQALIEFLRTSLRDSHQ